MDKNVFAVLKGYHDLFWYYYGVVGIIPLLILGTYKFFNPLNYKKFKSYEDFPHLLQDRLTRLLIFYSFFYYAIDILLLIGVGNFSICKLSYLYHHIWSCIFLPFILLLNHYPWFIFPPPIAHALMLLFPNFTSLNYIYLFLIFFIIYSYFQPPFSKFTRYVYLRWTTILALNSLVPLWLFGCKNTFNND